MQSRVEKQAKKPTLFESTSTNLPSGPKDIWQENPVEAYQKFLEYAGREANDAIAYNRNVLDVLLGSESSEEEKKPVVDASRISVKEGRFFPLTGILGHNLYCSKLIIRNMRTTILSFAF